MRTIVLDTNVLLADPGALLSFPDAEVVIPETVLSELDKLKTSRVDPDLRFRGREVSRILFDLSEQGSLIGGVDLPDGGRLRVVPLDADAELPEGLSARNADDRILGVAMQVCRDCGDLTLVTNDLNMLLKAQTLGVAVERHEGGAEGSFSKRYIVRPFQRYKIPLGILAVALAVFAAVVFVALFANRAPVQQTVVPTEFRDQLNTSQQKTLDYLLILQRNPDDLETRLALANLYFDLMQHVDRNYARLAVKHYQFVIDARPNDLAVKTDLATAQFYSGNTDRAIQLTTQVLDRDRNQIQANFNLGIFYFRGRQDFTGAARQFERVLELTKGSSDSGVIDIRTEAQKNLAQVRVEAANAGTPLPGSQTTTGGTQ